MSTAARTSTFMFTDIEGSTRLWEEQRDAMATALAAHDATLRAAVEESGGNVVKTTGDGMLASFDRPEAALTAALRAQFALDTQPWPGTRPLRVRIAIHSGSADMREGDFFGPALNRAARLLALGHGGQVLVSGTTANLAADDLPRNAELIDLGEHRLRDLDRPEHIYQLSAPGLRREFPPLRTTSDHPTNLRPQNTSFVGRARELADVLRLLATNRLVTLVGVGGNGKTRLALQAAGDVVETYRDGVWLIELAPLSDPDLLVAEIGRTLRVQQQPGQPPIDTIADYLRSKELLLLLDNCEHLIAAVAETTDFLLGSCPALKALTTSREPLGVGGEAVMAVPSLALPAAIEEGGGHPVVDADAVARTGQSEAVALFVERARATLPEFTLDRSNVSAVVEICRRLDGIPLALELAAARVNVLSADEIAQGLGDRFRLLTGGRRTAVPRQRTLQALIDWSWDLLDDADRRLLRRLAAFSGGWSLDAAAAVTSDVAGPSAAIGASPAARAARLATLDGLGRLVDRSLVVVDHTSTTRYRMLETIRQYAADQLAASAETSTFRDRHLAYFRSLALEAESELEGPEMAAWLARLDGEMDNLRTALDWAADADPFASLEICVAIARYWRSRTMGPGGRDRLLKAVADVRALPEPDSEPARRKRLALIARALSAVVETTVMGLGASAASLDEEALAAAREAGDPAAIADALYVSLFAANPMATGGRRAEWRLMADEAMAIATELGDWGRVGQIAASVALIEVPDDPAVAERWLERASDALGRVANPRTIAYLAQVRGRVASSAGRPTDAERWFREAESRFEAIGDRRFALSAQSELAHTLRHMGRLDDAEREYHQTLHGWQQSGNRGAVAHQLESIAFLATARGLHERAARLLGAAEALRDQAAPMTALERGEYDTEVSRLRGALEASTFNAAWAAGRALTADVAVALALGG